MVNLRPVKVPVERVSRTVRHHVDAGERVCHAEEPGLVRCRCQKVDERLPLVEPCDPAPRNLIATNRMVDRPESSERGVACSQILDLVIKIDVVLPRVGKRCRPEQRLDFGDASFERLRAYEPLQVEHAGFAQVVPAAREQRPTANAVGAMQGKAFEVEELPHGCLFHVRSGLFPHPRISHESPGLDDAPASTAMVSGLRNSAAVSIEWVRCPRISHESPGLDDAPASAAMVSDLRNADAVPIEWVRSLVV